MCLENQNEQTEKTPEEAPMYNLSSDQKTAESDCWNEQPMQQQNGTQQVGEQTDQSKLNSDFPYSFPSYPHNDNPINNTQLPYDAQRDYTQIQPTAPKMETPLLTRRNSEYENMNVNSVNWKAFQLLKIEWDSREGIKKNSYFHFDKRF